MILNIKNLTYTVSGGAFLRFGKKYKIIDNFSLDLDAGENIIIYGDRYSGKNIILRLITRLIKPSAGEVYYRGINILSLSKSRLIEVRKKIQTIFQDPIGMFDDRLTIGKNIEWIYNLAGGCGDFKWIFSDILKRYGLGESILNIYPTDLTLYEKQLISIARSLILSPEILLIENPTIFVDWDKKEKLVSFLEYIRREYNLSYLIFTSDLYLIKNYGDKIGILNRGRLIEFGPKDDIINNPKHPYTKKILSNEDWIYDVGDVVEYDRETLLKYGEACRYYECPYRNDKCDVNPPKIGDEHSFVKCILYKK